MNNIRFLKPRFLTPLSVVLGTLTAMVGFVALGADKLLQGPGEAWIAPGRAARKANPLPVEANSLAQGKELFAAGCFPCHGASGKGDGPASSTLEREGKPVRPGNLSDPKLWEQSDGAIFWKISEGRTPMPAFQETFTEEQRWQIVNYVRTLAPKQQTNNTGIKTGAK